MKLGINLGIVRGGNYLNKEAASFVSRVVAAGGSLSVAELDAVNKFFEDISAFRSKILRLNFFIGDGLTAALIPVIYNADGSTTPLGDAADTNNNFVSGDYNRTTGLIGNGSTKYLGTGFNPSLIAEFGLNDAGLIVFTQSNENGDYEDLATSDGTQLTRINPFITATTVRGQVNGNSNVDRTGSGAAGFYAVIRTGAATTKIYQAGVQIGTTATNASTAKPNANLNVFRRGGSANTYSPRRLKGYAITTGLIDAEVLALYTAWAAVHTKIGR